MSNFANIQRTIFVDLPNKTETYGYRIYDDYGIEFDNTMTKEDLELPPRKFVDKIEKTFCEIGGNVFDAAIERGGIHIDGVYYGIELTDSGWKWKESEEDTTEAEEKIKSELGVDHVTLG